jgi:hypothetical protein
MKSSSESINTYVLIQRVIDKNNFLVETVIFNSFDH